MGSSKSKHADGGGGSVDGGPGKRKQKKKKEKKPKKGGGGAEPAIPATRLSGLSSEGREDGHDLSVDPRSPRGLSGSSSSQAASSPASTRRGGGGENTAAAAATGNKGDVAFSSDAKVDDGGSALLRRNEEGKSPEEGGKSESGGDAAAEKETMIYSGNDGSRRVNKDDFVIDALIGKGSFGKVFLVHGKDDSNAFYAMKVLRKDRVVARKQVAHTMTERGVLERIQHPFVVKLHYAFQTAEKLYMILDFVNGGELFFHLKQEGRFSEARTRFYVAELTMALAHLHRIGIVYRDLKPENILLTAAGHIAITDFGLSKELAQNEGTKTFCGTPEYLAPEILLNQGHNTAVDWWSLGTFMYEMLTGLPPFYSQNQNIMYQKILNAELKFPSFVSAEAQSLLRGLLNRNPNERLGNTGEQDGDDVMAHPFFLGLNWTKLYNLEEAPPFIPPVRSPTDLANIDPVFTSERAVDSVQTNNALDTIAKNDQFKGFTFEADSAIQAADNIR